MSLEKERIKAVIGFLVTAKKVLLAYKLSGIGAGYYMPYGGKVEPGETFEQAMIRELYEEAEVSTEHEDLEHVGTIYPTNYRYGKFDSAFEIPLFLIHSWNGTVRNSKELINPRWFPRSKHHLPIPLMLPGEQIYLPKILAGKQIAAYYTCELEPRVYFKPGTKPIFKDTLLRRIRWPNMLATHPVASLFYL